MKSGTGVDLSPERDWSDARDFVHGFWLALQADAPGEYVFASGQRHRVADLVACAFRAAGLNYSVISVQSHLTHSASLSRLVTGLCGNPRRAESALAWRREWTFEQTIEDMVCAELEKRPEVERANPRHRTDTIL